VISEKVNYRFSGRKTNFDEKKIHWTWSRVIITILVIIKEIVEISVLVTRFTHAHSRAPENHFITYFDWTIVIKKNTFHGKHNPSFNHSDWVSPLSDFQMMCAMIFLKSDELMSSADSVRLFCSL
jgi:hypothetical protein